MSIQLETISFNHDPASATADALSIRRDNTHFISIPEWRRGLSIAPHDSVAAYAINAVRGNTITVRVQLSASGWDLSVAEVRAIHFQPITPVAMWTPWSAYYPWLYYYWWLYSPPLPGSSAVLGEVKAQNVTFNASGESGLVFFELENHGLDTAGVGIHTVVWRWQFRRSPAEPWTDFAQSSHLIYTVLEVPTAPWVQTPQQAANTQLPWTEVLDVACAWASGASDLDEAATRITEEVFELGHSILEYGCAIGSQTQYAFPAFNCTAFLDRLHGGFGNGAYVNCTDCATIVSTFANILGCSLWQSRMGEFSPFALNPIIAIGSQIWQSACGFPQGFLYHEVAWKRACDVGDEVFDACLILDGDADPTRSPHMPLLPANILFGNTGDGTYRDRLAAPQGRQFCEPQPDTRVRRWVY